MCLGEIERHAWLSLIQTSCVWEVEFKLSRMSRFIYSRVKLVFGTITQKLKVDIIYLVDIWIKKLVSTEWITFASRIL